MTVSFFDFRETQEILPSCTFFWMVDNLMMRYALTVMMCLR
ncbi:MAG: hypothetical protein AAGJ08_06785 [Cyanobacteria bacterium P01_H01_bin.35]